MAELAEGLAASRDVRVICSQPTHWARAATGLRNGARFQTDSLLMQMLNLLITSMSMTYSTQQRARHGELLFVLKNPPSLPFVVVLEARLRRARIAIRTDAGYPNMLVAAGLERQRSLSVRAIKRAIWALFRCMVGDEPGIASMGAFEAKGA